MFVHSSFNCLLYNHSFETNLNSATNLFFNFSTKIAPASLFFIHFIGFIRFIRPFFQCLNDMPNVSMVEQIQNLNDNEQMWLKKKEMTKDEEAKSKESGYSH